MASPATFYKLKAKYGGMDLSDDSHLTPLVQETMAMRPRQLEDENAKLKRLVADVMLDNVVLKDLLGNPAASFPTTKRSSPAKRS